MVVLVTDATSGRIAAFFDLDKTIIARSSILAFSRPFFHEGLLDRRTLLTSSYAQLLYVLTAADHDRVDRMREHIARMCAGWDVEQIRSIVAETLDEVVMPLVFAEARDLIADHRSRGHDVIIVSASGEEIVAPIARALGATRGVGSRMRIVDGRYTGELDFYCFGETKAAAVADQARLHGYDLALGYAYSDSITDVPMLRSVGHARAVNPDRALRRYAIENDWPVMTFERPVPLTRSLRRPERALPALVAALSATVALVGATMYVMGRRRA
ncbi:HAD-IB family hydrolase [Rhodococcus yananensis]|uniref:HAD-IB family hydrolase n=1 Tax=Rhodococcus yananensis TaxID=2879464 RepID=UPI003EC12D8B